MSIKAKRLNWLSNVNVKSSNLIRDFEKVIAILGKCKDFTGEEKKLVEDFLFNLGDLKGYCESDEFLSVLDDMVIESAEKMKTITRDLAEQREKKK